MKSTFENLKIVISNKKYNTNEDILEKLDVLLLGNRISIDEYKLLVNMLNENE